MAVVDTGVDMAHPELASQIWVNTDEIVGNGIDDDHNGYVDDVHGWDFASNDNNPTDGNGHGTHVAGTIAAHNNGIGSTGVAPARRLCPYGCWKRWFGDRYGGGRRHSLCSTKRRRHHQHESGRLLQFGHSVGDSIRTCRSTYSSWRRPAMSRPRAFAIRPASARRYPMFSRSERTARRTRSPASATMSASSGAVQVDAPGVNVYSTYYNGSDTRPSAERAWRHRTWRAWPRWPSRPITR